MLPTAETKAGGFPQCQSISCSRAPGRPRPQVVEVERFTEVADRAYPVGLLAWVAVRRRNHDWHAVAVDLADRIGDGEPVCPRQRQIQHQDSWALMADPRECLAPSAAVLTENPHSPRAS